MEKPVDFTVTIWVDSIDGNVAKELRNHLATLMSDLKLKGKIESYNVSPPRSNYLEDKGWKS